jgi:hypothetical protein
VTRVESEHTTEWYEYTKHKAHGSKQGLGLGETRPTQALEMSKPDYARLTSPDLESTGESPEQSRARHKNKEHKHPQRKSEEYETLDDMSPLSPASRTGNTGEETETGIENVPVEIHDSSSPASRGVRPGMDHPCRFAVVLLGIFLAFGL